MMGDVIQFKQNDDFKVCKYTVDDMSNFGVSLLDTPIEVVTRGADTVELFAHGEVHIYTREDFAEFIHVCRILIDPDDKWMPDGKLIAKYY